VCVCVCVFFVCSMFLLFMLHHGDIRCYVQTHMLIHSIYEGILEVGIHTCVVPKAGLTLA
jgi:hypothetical protein